MLTGWTNSNEKKFKSLYKNIIGRSLAIKSIDDEKRNESNTKHLDTGTAFTQYENRTKDQIYNMARELDIEGRSYMNKDELIEAVRETRH